MPIESFVAVAFDCDSTLSTLEGIDELAERRGCADEIAPLTTAAMEGRLAIEEIYGRRLDVLRPTQDDLTWLGRRYIETLVPGAQDAVRRLQRAGREVFVVSGGLRAPVVALAGHLGIAADRVHAVEVALAADGSYLDYDRASPLTRADGKALIARRLKTQFGSLVLIGDGVTDVAARAGGACVVGFGGVVRRPAVEAAADHFIEGPSLAAVADYLLG